MMSNDGDWQGKMIGRYQCERRLGQGGMGEVWLATDTQLRRQVAVKLLPPVLVKDRKYLSAFANEAQASASLEHPHILSIHDFGEHEMAEGEIIPYLVMPYVDGGTLQMRINQASGKLAVEQCLYYLRQAALAIDYAHSKQVLHRDIKPANMLLQQDWLLLSDFGIAKILSEITQRDQTQRGAGTPEFMAPEQIAGHAEAASDRYSLAVIAYWLFAGRLPLQGRTAHETYELQMRQEPIAPRQFNSAIPLEVEQILLRGLAKQVQQRPASCLTFVDELEHAWHASMPAEKDPDVTALAPWSRRWQGAEQDYPGGLNPYGLAATTSAYQTPETVSTPMQAEGTWSNSATVLPATQAASDVEPPLPTQAEKSEQKKPGRRAVLIGGIVAGAAVIAGAAAGGDILYNTYFKTPAGPQKLIPGVPMLTLTGHTGVVWLARWDPTGRYLVTSGDGADVMLWDIEAALQRLTGGQTQHTPLHTFTVANVDYKNAINEICWSSDGRKLIATGNQGNKIYLLDPFNPGTPTVYSDLDAIDLDAFLAYGTVCAGPQQDMFTVTLSDKAQIWQIGQTDKPVVQLRSNLGKFNYTSAMSWSYDGGTLAAVNSNFGDLPQLLFWQDKERALARVFTLPPRNKGVAAFSLTSTVAWSPVDAHILLLTLGDVGVLWDAMKNRAMFGMGLGANIDLTVPAMSGMSWSPNGRYVIGSYDVLGNGTLNIDQPLTPKIYIWDINKVRQGNPKEVQPPLISFGDTGPVTHKASIIDIQWSPDGRYVATASADHKVIIWKVDGA